MNSAAERADYWRDPVLDNLELLSARFVTHRFAPHTHDGYAIGVVEQGAELFGYRGARHVAPSGSILLIHPGEVHDGGAFNTDGWRYRMLYPSIELIERAARDVFGPRFHGMPYFAQAVVTDAAVFADIAALHRILEAGASAVEREAEFLTVMTRLTQRHAHYRAALPTLADASSNVRRARAMIDGRYAEDLSLDALAAEARLNRFQLLRAFKRAVGMSPHVYLTHVRVRQARALLAQGVAPAQVAADVGFVDQAHLTRQFKRIVGVGPGRYAQFPTRRDRA
jgi:AraC-like DNA-binding protein